MLLANRRLAFLHFLLAAMQAAWIATFLALAWSGTPSILGIYGSVLGGLLGWMLALELLSRATETPRYDALAMVLLVIVSLLLALLAVYRGGKPWDPSWMGRILDDPTSGQGRIPRVAVLVGANILLWQRASAATSRGLNFFSVGVTFRSGLLLLLLGGTLLGAFRGIVATGLLWTYLGAGLSAVAVSRISEKATDAQSIGRLLPPVRLAQTLAAVGGAIGISWLAALFYSTADLRGLLRLLTPVWRILRPILHTVLLALARLLNPVLLWLESVIARLWGSLSPMLSQIGVQPGNAVALPGVSEAGPTGVSGLVRDVLLLVAILVAVGAGIAFLLLYLERVRKSGLQGEAEDEAQDRASFGGGILGRALDSLRGAAGLVRRFGLGRELLAAISVQNIYANLCRIARQEGRPRLPSQPPDSYLPVLVSVFPGEEERLSRITAAYMRVHYGDKPVAGDELAGIRADYVFVREARAEAAADRESTSS